MFDMASSIRFLTMVQLKVLLLTFLLNFCKGDNTTHFYKAAVVEYATPLTPLLSSDEVLIRNAAKYVEFMNNASKQQVDIIVFPEDGLYHGNSKSYVEVPSPTSGIAPCDESTIFHQALVLLSCASRSLGLYTVINLREINHNTSTNQTFWYNSNVAFDRNGTVVARYRKFNPYGEFVNKTATPEYSVFMTDFGVLFGMFTCFDIEFKEPALVLAQKYGVHHFAFPNCWSSELPFLTAIQMQWGWSFTLDVVMLASGCNDPLAGGSGSGIYIGKKSIPTYVQTNSHTSKMLIATVPVHFDHRPNQTNPIPTTTGENRAKTTPVNVEPNLQENTFTVSAEVSNQSNSYLVMLRDYLDVYETKEMIDYEDLSTMNMTFRNNSIINLTLTTATTLCQNDFCCDFKVDVTDSFSTTPLPRVERGDDLSRYMYRLAVFDGVRSYGGGVATGGVQVCGIISCLNDTILSCGLRANTSQPLQKPAVGNLYKVSTNFNRIDISANFNYSNSFIFPSVLVMGANDEFGQLLDQDEVMFDQYEPFNNKSLCSLKINKTIANLITASLYARQFDQDGEPSTKLSNAIVVSISLYLITLSFLVSNL